MKKVSLLILLSILTLSCSKEKRSDKAGEKMQEFVINISNYARNFDHDFIIIPQNGVELAFNNLAPDEGTHSRYMSAINGIGVEELFYNGDYALDGERLEMLQQLKPSKKILVSEYTSNDNNVADALNQNYKEGFICFPRVNSNYDYLQIPDTASRANTNNITSLDQAQNYLYLISSDNFETKQDMINAVAATNFDVVLIDLFFNSEEFTANEIQQLKTKANGAKRLVISYINIGSAENYRYYWQSSWKLHHPRWIKKKYEGYDDEYWVKFWKKDWQEVIYGNDYSYMKKIINVGFDGAYLDNVEAFYFLYFDE